MGVERRCDRPNQETSIVREPNDISLNANDAVCGERLKPRSRSHEPLRASLVTSADPGKINLEITHQALDQVRAQAVIRRQSITLGCRKLTVEHPLRMASQDNFILKITLRQTADRRRPEPQQNIRWIGGVPLKIPVEESGGLSSNKAVLGQREMIEANPVVSGGDKRLCDRFSLIETGSGVGQDGFVDLLLMLLEGGHVGIAEDCETVTGRRSMQRLTVSTQDGTVWWGRP